VCSLVFNNLPVSNVTTPFVYSQGDEEGTGVISDPSLLDQKDMGATMSDFM